MIPMTDPIIRAAQDEDFSGLIRLIGTVFTEYPGCIFDANAEFPELLAPASEARACDGYWWVALMDEAIVGSVAVVPETPERVELKRLYVSKHARKRGLGARLVLLAENAARAGGARALFLWTDRRFEDAHRLYERLGYRREPRTRVVGDLSNSVEFHYTKDIGP